MTQEDIGGSLPGDHVESTGRNSLKTLWLEEVYAWHPNIHKDVIN